MTTFWKCLLSLGLAAILVSPTIAQNAKAKKKAAARKEQPAVQLPKDITLTDEQKTKVAEIEKEYAPKMKELREKLDKVMTEEQKQARLNVMKEAREKGKDSKEAKRGKELQQAIKEAMKLSEEQQKKYDETDKQIVALRLEILEKVKPILTDEQKEKLPKRPERKKPKAAKV